MTIRITINNRAVRPECITVIESPLPWIERRVNWERYRNWLALRGDCADVRLALVAEVAA